MNVLKQIMIATLILVQGIVYGQENKTLKQLTAQYDNIYNELNVGMGILIINDGAEETVSLGKYQFDKNTVFNIGSATKKFTSILILQEQEKGNLKISDKIGQYLGEIKNVDGNLTIEMLMRHKSGLGEIAGREAERIFFQGSDSLYTHANFIGNIPPSNPELVGKHDYCNTNYFLLGYILEKVTGKKYFDLLEEQIFTPCNMDNTYSYTTKDIPNHIHPTHGGRDVNDFVDTRFYTDYVFSAGCISSTLEDQASFYKQLFTTNTILSDKSLAQLISFDEADYGLGMEKITKGDIEYIGHGGNNIGYGFREYYNPSTKEIVLIASNTMTIPMESLIKKDLFNYIQDKDESLTFNQKLATDYEANLGTYYFKEMDTNVTLLARDNNLFISLQGMEILLISYQENVLSTTQYGIEIETLDNNTEELIFKQGGMSASISRVKS